MILPEAIRVTPAAAAPPLVAPEPPPAPPEPPDGVGAAGGKAEARRPRRRRRAEREATREVTGGISWFGRRTDPDTQGGIMARAGIPCGYLPGYNGIPSRRGHRRRHQVRRPADVERRPAPVRADRAAAGDGAGGVCVGAALPGGVRRRGAEARRRALPGRPRPGPVHHQGRPAGRTTRSGCSPCRARRSCGSTPAVARPAGPPSWGTRGPTSTCGRRSWRGRSTRPADGRATSSTWPTGTGCSPAVWERTTAPSGSAAPWCPSRAG